jgi:DNA topoisomerase II
MYTDKTQQWQLAEMQRDLDKLSNQARFVQMIIDNKLTISKKKKTVLMAELKKLDFMAFAKVDDAKKAGEQQQVAEESEDEEDAAIGAHDYDYLLGVWSFSASFHYCG